MYRELASNKLENIFSYIDGTRSIDVKSLVVPLELNSPKNSHHRGSNNNVFPIKHVDGANIFTHRETILIFVVPLSFWEVSFEKTVNMHSGVRNKICKPKTFLLTLFFPNNRSKFIVDYGVGNSKASCN